MTISRLAAAGAIVLNVPMIFAASILPVGAVVAQRRAACRDRRRPRRGHRMGDLDAAGTGARRCNAGRLSRRRAHRRLVTPPHTRARPPSSTSQRARRPHPPDARASSCRDDGCAAACQTRLGPPPTLSGCAGSVRPRRMMSPSRSDYEAHNSGGPIPFLPELPWIDPHLLLVPGIGRRRRRLAAFSGARSRLRQQLSHPSAPLPRRLRASRIRFGIRLLRAISRNSTAFRFGRRCPALRPREIARFERSRELAAHASGTYPQLCDRLGISRGRRAIICNRGNGQTEPERAARRSFRAGKSPPDGRSGP